MPTSVKFGDAEAAEVTYVSDTQLTVVLPEGTAGPVDVSVETSSGTDTLADGFEYLDEPNFVLDVPDTVEMVVGEATVYSTRMANYGADAADSTEEIRLSNAAGDLTAADVVYETQDVGQTWKTVEWTEDGGDLVVTYTYTHIAAGADHTSDVRVTVVRADTGDISGRSQYTSEAGDVLVQADYTYAVSGGA